MGIHTQTLIGIAFYTFSLVLPCPILSGDCRPAVGISARPILSGRPGPKPS
jgi:hypothetical protein